MNPEDIKYVLENHERAAQIKSGRKPNGRPVMLFKNAIRLEWIGNYPDFAEARKAIERILDGN
jgi:hypothetical protein